MNVTLFLQLDRNDNAQFPQAVLLNSAGTIVGTVNMSISSVDGKYTGIYTFTETGDYSVKYVVFSDAARTTINNTYRFSDETIRVSDLEQNIEDILTGNVGQPVAVFD